MERKSFAAMDCSVAQCLEVIGEWWSMLIVRDTFMGVRRFDDFQRRLGISRNILQHRLTRLIDAGVLDRRVYSERPLRHEYVLTQKGRDLWPVLTAMRQWGDQHAAPDGPPITLVHRHCGRPSQAVLVCDQCGERLDGRGMRVIEGPGYKGGDLLSHLAERAAPADVSTAPASTTAV